MSQPINVVDIFFWIHNTVGPRMYRGNFNLTTGIYILCYCCDRQTHQYHYWWVCLSQQSPWYKPCIWCMSGVPQFNSSPPSATYMRRWTGPSLVQVNGLSPIRHRAITWTNAGLLTIGLLGTNFSEIWIVILSFSFRKMHLKMLSAKMAAILSMGRWVNMALHAVQGCLCESWSMT